MFDIQKFKNLIRYVCWECRDDPSKLGAVKLNKALWFSDVIAFAKTGTPITGARYVKQQFGPVPKAILPALRELEQQNNLRIEEVEYYRHKKRQFVALSEPDMGGFSADELAIIDDVVKLVCDGHTASSISSVTHDAIWKLAELGEDIPLHAVLASQLGPISDADVTRAKDRMKVAA